MTLTARIAPVAALFAIAISAAPARAADGPMPGAVTAEKAVLPDGPGSVRGLGGAADIAAPSAQVQYGVDIEVPTAAGIAPALGLAYRGELGNGPLGVGWELSQPAIRRSTRLGVPHFDGDDELEISGVGSGRLVRIPDGSYRVEGAGNTIRALAVGNRWEVSGSDGTVYFFGLSDQSRQEATVDGALRTVAWLPELVVHPSGRTVAYHYSHDGNQLYLADAVWGPDGRYRVEVELEGRPDPVTSYRDGFAVVTARRVHAIRVRVGGEIVRTYHLGYDDRLPLSRLASVGLTGRGDHGALAPVSFGYAAPAMGGLQAMTGTDGWQLNARGVSLLDVDGDGLDDLLRLEAGHHQVRHNHGGGFDAAVDLTGAEGAALETSQLLDLDGDGRAELVRTVDDSWRGYRLDAATGRWAALGTWPGSAGVPLGGRGVLVDLDGDGRSDVVEASGDGLRVARSGPGGLRPRLSLPPISASDPGVVPGAANVRFADVNGDGLADAVWLTDAWMKIFLGTGDGHFVAWRRVFYPWGEAAVAPRDLLLADLDRDGILDLVRLFVGHVAWYPGRPDGGFAAPRAAVRPEAADADVVVAIADGNGNGSADVVWSSPRGMWLLDLAGPTSAGMLTSIDNGLGQVTTFAYEGSAVLAAQAAAAGQPWQATLPISIPVPVSSQVQIAGEPLRRTDWGVRDGLWDRDERRFGGFLETRRVTAADTAHDTAVITTSYHPGTGAERVLRGQPTMVRVASGLGEVATITSTRWEAHRIDGLPDQPLLRRAVARATTTAHHEGVTEPITTASWVVVDGEGRVVQDYQAGRTDRSGDETLTVRRYADGDQPRIRDRVCEESQYSGDGRTLVAVTRHYFGAPSGDPLPLCQVGLGLSRAVHGWLAEENRWVLLSETRYDDRWNPVDALADGVRRSYGYDAAGLHVVSEDTSPTAGKTLHYAMTWDDALDAPSSVTDPAGVEIRLGYDDLGRVVSRARGGQPAHVHHVYDWSAPRPVTRTFTFDGAVADLGPLPGAWTPGGHWREEAAVTNGAAEPLYSAVHLTAGRWIIRDWTERDRRGRTVAVGDAFHWDGADPRAAARTATAPVQRLRYDAFDRVVEQTLASGSACHNGYGALTTVRTCDGLAAVTSFLDGQGRIARTERLVAGVVESVDAVYDAAGRITSMTLQKGGAQELEHRFRYDTLGRLAFATDPDVGDRHLGYDDGGRIVGRDNAVGQHVGYGYDGAGRLTSITADDGSSFVYHYDQALDAGTFRGTAGKLAWVEEPTGKVQLGYDAFGRPSRVRRAINGQSADLVTTSAPSGLPLRIDHGDGFAYDIGYDAAARAIQVGELWSLDEQDADGRVLRERYGAHVTQISSPRNAIGQAEHLRVERDGTALYDVGVTYNAFGAPATVVDHDGAGLDHSATFFYDAGARITDAALGAAAQPYHFTYQYDGLQNLTRRTASGPRAIGTLTGSYLHGVDVPGQPRRGPRQLRSIVPDSGAATVLDYDGAGRQIKQGNLQLDYNGLDQLIRVRNVPRAGGGTGTVEHAYGHDGLRVYSRDPTGQTQIWFNQDLAQIDGARDHYVRLGGRLIARVTQKYQGGGTSTRPRSAQVRRDGARLADHSRAALALVGVGLVLAALPRRRRRLRRGLAALLCVAQVLGGCGALFGSDESALWTTSQTLYYHHGVAAGPILITRADGSVFEERRFEPFGDDLDAMRTSSAGTEIGAVDFGRDPSNVLGKTSDVATGWSYHGARWMAPETARWLTPDPPAKAPDPRFMREPWALHPYQYVDQNPMLYWDADGRDKSATQAKPKAPAKPKENVLVVYGYIGGVFDKTTPKSMNAAIAAFAHRKIGNARIDVVPVKTFADIERAVSAKTYDRVVYIGHGVLDAPAIKPGDRVGEDALYELIAAHPSIKRFDIMSCSSSDTGLAQDLAFGFASRLTTGGWSGLVDLNGVWDADSKHRIIQRFDIVPHHVEGESDAVWETFSYDGAYPFF